MTHTLHRKGSEKSFDEDFVVFAMTAKKINETNCKKALSEFLRILSKYSISNMGDMKTGNRYLVDQATIIDNVQDTSIVHAVFTDKEEMKKALREIKEANLGVSVIISGIVNHVDEMTQEVGIDRHTVEYSVGIKGNLSRLPEEELLEITTMCGHGMVSQNLARQMLLDIKRGKRSAKEAGEILATPCVCGVFNPQRAQRLLEELAEVWCFDEI